jgi:uncharacterized protein YbaR (Trm112 family)
MNQRAKLICPQTKQPLTFGQDGQSYSTPDHRFAYLVED